MAPGLYRTLLHDDSLQSLIDIDSSLPEYHDQSIHEYGRPYLKPANLYPTKLPRLSPRKSPNLVTPTTLSDAIADTDPDSRSSLSSSLPFTTPPLFSSPSPASHTTTHHQDDSVLDASEPDASGPSASELIPSELILDPLALYSELNSLKNELHALKLQDSLTRQQNSSLREAYATHQHLFIESERALKHSEHARTQIEEDMRTALPQELSRHGKTLEELGEIKRKCERLKREVGRLLRGFEGVDDCF